MWLSIVICVIWRGSVLLPPLYFALRWVYKAKNRPTGHIGEQAGPGTSLDLGQGEQAWVTQPQKPPVKCGMARATSSAAEQTQPLALCPKGGDRKW